MSEYDELKRLAEMADERGDKETALAALQKMETLSANKTTQPNNSVDFVKALAGEGNASGVRTDLGLAGGGGSNSTEDWKQTLSTSPPAGFLYGMGETARDTGARAKQLLNYFNKPSYDRVTKEYDQERAERQQFKQGMPEQWQSAVPAGQITQGVAQFFSVPGGRLAARVLGGFGIGTMQYVPEGDKTLGVDSNVMNPIIGGVTAGVTPAIMRGVAEGAKMTGNVARGTLNVARGVQNPWSPVKEQLLPMARNLAGTSRTMDNTGKIVRNQIESRQLNSIDDVAQFSDDYQATFGQKPDMLLSRRTGSDRVATAEGNTSSVARLVDKAKNEEARITDEATNVIERTAKSLNAGKITERRAGRYIAAATDRAKNSILADADIQWNADSEPLYQLFSKAGNKKIIGDRNQLAYLESLKSSEEVLGRVNTDVVKTINHTQETIAKNGRLSYDDFVKRRSNLSKSSTKNNFLGLQGTDAKKAAYGLAQAAEADMMESATRLGANESHQAAFTAARTNYSNNMSRFDAVDESVFGKLLGKQNASFEEFAKAAVAMDDSLYSRQITALREVAPDIDKKIGRFLYDKALEEAKRGSKASSTASKYDPSKIHEVLSNNEKFLKTFPDQDRKKVGLILKHLDYIADKHGMKSGGASGNLISEQGQQAQVAATRDPGFIVRRLYDYFMGPTMLDALYTPKGREAMLKVTRAIYSGAPPSTYTAPAKYLMDNFATKPVKKEEE
jgi:hypothetical protein